MACGSSSAKSICSICYEDLKPIVEDLQAISICGHVLHELCLQQWFEYCPKGKRKSCPVCKQSCSEADVSRLYFQSVGDPNEAGLSQKPVSCGESPEELRREVIKLEGKVSGLSSALERQQKDLQELNEELYSCKDEFKKETLLKKEALKQKTSIQQLLHLKTEELDKSTSECMRLQERNMALAKELAAIKLVSDLNLEEEEVVKLASFGNAANHKDTIDVLKKSLVIRNKSYKELMAKCNNLGRGESRSLSKLEKAKEKIKTLKTRVRELEMAAEIKDNEVLRALKVSKKSARKAAKQDAHPSQCQREEPSPSKSTVEKFESSKDVLFTKAVNEKDPGVHDQGMNFHILVDDDSPQTSNFMHPVSKLQVREKEAVQISNVTSQYATPNSRKDVLAHTSSDKDGASGLISETKHDMSTNTSAATDRSRLFVLDDAAEVQPLLHIRDDTSSPAPISQPGDRCFAGGLLGPDGTKRHLGKWCKRAIDKGSTASHVAKQQSSFNGGNLISIGADGRGGSIKVLRSINESDSTATPNFAKRCKYGGAKTSELQAKGCLQIEHFFGKVGK